MTTEVANGGAIPQQPNAQAATGNAATITAPNASGFTQDQLLVMAGDLVKGGMSEQQAAGAYLRSLVADGYMSAEEAAARMQAEGIASNDSFSPINPAVRDWLTTNGLEPAQPHQYFVPQLTEEPSPIMDKAARGWLASGGFPVGNGNALLDEIAKVGAQWKSMNEGQREIYKRTELSRFREIHRSNADAKLHLANQLATEIDAKQPGLMDLLENSGAGNSATVLHLISMQAESLAGRP